ncbi:efflux transporter outer membrane subunit [Frigidibacter sp. MR17.14]|uniref:efflux transporter outer membrane subunit n=1 Tax=Frigidibacter sp. MR17.14 TaxID=3126509 RepID=UPI0030131383
MSAVVLSAAVLSACAPDRVYRAPFFPFASKYDGARAGAPVLLQNDRWWDRLGDPALDRVVAQALSGNIDLAVARERLVRARAVRASTSGGGNLGGLTADLTLEDLGSGTERSGRLDWGQEGQLELTWLLDPWGGRKARLKAADARIEAAAAEVSAARLSILRQVSLAYVDLRYTQALLARRSADLALRREALGVAQQLQDAGESTRRDLLRTRARIASTEAQLPVLRAQVNSLQIQLAVLAGVAPGTLDLDGLKTGSRQPRPPLPATLGVPADLLRNRPDIRIAEREYYAALADVDEAEAARWPQLSLGGTLTRVGGAASGASVLLGPSLEIPELFSTQPKARAAAAASSAREAHLAWKATVISAVGEVEDQLSLYAAARDAVSAQERSARLYRETLGLTDEMLRLSTATISDRLDAMEDLSSAETALVSSLRDQGRAFVELNVAIGAGAGG